MQIDRYLALKRMFDLRNTVAENQYMTRTACVNLKCTNSQGLLVYFTNSFKCIKSGMIFFFFH